MEPAGAINVYLCEFDHAAVTINVDEGVTPFMMVCTAKGCKGVMKSSFYDAATRAKHGEPAYEWYKPDVSTKARLRKLNKNNAAVRDHIKQSGLMLRVMGEAGVFDPVQPVRSEGKQPRNAKCNCGSGKKAKHCCLSLPRT